MSKSDDHRETAFNRAFIARTRAIRESVWPAQPEAAQALRIRPGTYNKYENRGPMKHYLIPEFCRLTGRSLDDLFGIGDTETLPVPTLDMFLETATETLQDLMEESDATGEPLDLQEFREFTRLVCRARLNDKRHKNLHKRERQTILRLVK